MIVVLFDLSIFVVLPTNACEAWFLKVGEKVDILDHIYNNQTGVESKISKDESCKVTLLLNDKLTLAYAFNHGMFTNLYRGNWNIFCNIQRHIWV